MAVRLRPEASNRITVRGEPPIVPVQDLLAPARTAIVRDIHPRYVDDGIERTLRSAIDHGAIRFFNFVVGAADRVQGIDRVHGHRGFILLVLREMSSCRADHAFDHNRQTNARHGGKAQTSEDKSSEILL